MKKTLNAFSSVLSIRRIAVVLAVVVACGASNMAYSATNNGCDDSGDNEFISPEIALCTVHAYNIGSTTNPSSEAQKQAMKEVVALKTTLMTQQMYKQYESLDAMVRRLKTQLKKAVLTTSLQAVGAAAEEASGTAPTDKRIVLAGTQNCMVSATTPLDAARCLQSNTQTVINAVNSGNTRDAKKQLVQDIGVAEAWKIIDDKDKDLIACKNKLSASSSKDVLDCAQKLLVAIGTYNYKEQSKQRTKISGLDGF